MKKHKDKVIKIISAVLAAALIQISVSPQLISYAQVRDYDNGIRFDAEFYAEANPDVKEAYGNDEDALLNHYLTRGILEGRKAYAGQDQKEIENLKLSYSKEKSTKASTDKASVTESSVADKAVLPEGGDISPENGMEQVDERIKSKGLVLVYLNGTDLEGDNGSATRAVDQMIGASRSGNTRFVIIAGGTKTWQRSELQSANNGNTVSYVIENGEIRELKNYGSKKEFLSSEMITEFINDTKQTYSSDHTSLVFWDHGGGAAGGYGKNEISKKGMSASAVAAGVKNSGEYFESVGFDTCLMGSLEVANNFAGTARYFLGSQENEGGHGWNFASYADYGNTDFVQFGKKLIDDYDVYTKKNDTKASIRTLAMYDMNVVPKAKEEWSSLISKLGNTQGGVELMAIARELAREFSAGSTADYRAGEVDLISFLEAFRGSDHSTEAEALLDTLNKVVVYKNANTMDQVNGISIYLPGENTYQFDDKYDDIKGNDLSDDVMKAYGKLASVYVGQRDNALFQQTSFDQKHDDRFSGYYRKKNWYDSESAKIGTGVECYYQMVQNGGFAVKSMTGMTPQMIESAELRVILKTDDFGYVSLGRTNTFCTTADKKSPVYNFNGQWLHINGYPVALYQTEDFMSNGNRILGMYSIATVNGKDSKLDIQWNDTTKKWGCYGYVGINESLTSKTRSRAFEEGDKIQFIYDSTDSGYKDPTIVKVFDPITYHSDDFKLETLDIDQTKDEVLFYGTITDTYGKTLCTPYFKADPNSSVVTEEKIKGTDPDITLSKDRSKEKWILKDQGEDSFLSCYLNPQTGAYERYNENTGAFTMIFKVSGDIAQYNENIGAGFYYDVEADRYYPMDEDGIIEGLEGVDSKTLEELLLMCGIDPDELADLDPDDLDIITYILFEYYTEDTDEENVTSSGSGSGTADAKNAQNNGSSLNNGSAKNSSITDNKGDSDEGIYADDDDEDYDPDDDEWDDDDFPDDDENEG